MANSDDPLAAWHKRLFLLLMFLEDLELKGTGVTRDYSRASLAAVERVVLDRFAHPDQVAWPTRRVFVEGLAAYIGETLMRKAGGAWTWPSEPAVNGFPEGTPQVSVDPALLLDPVSPVHLLQEAVGVRDGERFTEAYDRLAHAADERSRTDPAWRPIKEPTMADDPDPESAPLMEWLSQRAGAFADWVAAYAPDRTWDFTPGSLLELEELVRRVTPTVEVLNDPANRDFREGAAWYLGETMRRDLGGRWILNLRRSDDRNFPYVDRLGPRNAELIPVVVLETELVRPGYLRYRYQRASGRPLEVTG